MMRKLNWKRPAYLPLYLAKLWPLDEAAAHAALGGDIHALFGARIAMRASQETRDFRLLIATPGGLASQGTTSNFKGAIVERYEPNEVRAFIEEVVRSVEAHTWAQATESLEQVMWPAESEDDAEPPGSS